MENMEKEIKAGTRIAIKTKVQGFVPVVLRKEGVVEKSEQGILSVLFNNGERYPVFSWEDEIKIL